MVLLVIAAILAGCGGGGGTATPPPPTADFTLSTSPSTLSIEQMGSGATLTISVVPVNGFSGSVAITFPDLPTGLSVSAGSMPGPPYSASPSAPLSVGISASRAAVVGNGTIKVNGTSGSLAHMETLNTTVSAAVDFQLSASPATVTIGPNGRASAQITLTPGANFGSNSVFLNFPSVHVGNAGVDMSVSAQSLTAAQPQATVSFESGFQVAPGSYPVGVTGALGAQVVSVPLTLTVTNPAKACKSLSRSTVRRTDMNPTGVVYDPVHKLVFAAVQQTNTVEVYSSTTAETVAAISIPAPRQLDITADGSRILVGTVTSLMYWVDPVSLQVVGRVAADAPLFQGAGVQPYRPVALASGKVLVTLGDYPPDEWDPATNEWSVPLLPGFAAGDTLVRRSGDHRKAVVAAINENTLAIFDSATDSYGPVETITASAAALNADGSRLVVLGPSPMLPGGDQVTLYDAAFTVLATYQMTSLSTGAPVLDDVIFSRDGSTVFVLEAGYATALRATDLSFLGQVPSAGFGGVDYPSDIDESNMIFSPGQARSVNFNDGGSPCALGVNAPFNMAVTPPQSALNTTAPVTLRAGGGITAGSQVYFGAAPASGKATPGTNVATNAPISLQVTPPVGETAEAVNVTVTNPDGSVGIAPDAFSYGTSVLEVATNSGPVTGGTAVTMYGYGMAFDPSQIQVTVGGQPGTVTQAFAGAGISPFPFPMDEAKLTTPAGVAGAADIVITTPAGKATVPGGFHYLESVQNYAAASTLTQAVYDRSRQRLYAADGGSNVVNVFDVSARKFLESITVGIRRRVWR